MIVRFAVYLFLFSFGFAYAEDAKKRPNILFCFADDWGRYASCYKGLDGRPNMNDVVKTPNIDRIAARGVIFRNAFVGSPSCTPCRSALLSGRYFFNTGRGAILNGAQWDSAIPSLPLLLRDSVISARCIRCGVRAFPQMRRMVSSSMRMKRRGGR